MDELTHLLETQGFFSRSQALAHGLTDARLAAERRAGTWARMCQGYYTSPDRWQGADAVARHLLRADAACHQMGEVVAMSHLTGALAHGLDLWDLPLDTVHLTRLDTGAGRRANGVTHHRGSTSDADVRRVAGRAVLPAARCALETATTTDGERGLVVLDSVLRSKACTPVELRRQFEVMAHWPGTLRLHVGVRLADGLSGSVGETRLRWLLRCAGLPAPTRQHEVRDRLGRLVATCDMAWPAYGVILDFDGREKYEKFLAAGMTPGAAVFAEKQREDRIRELTGFLVVRVVRADLQRPGVLVERIRRALAQGAERVVAGR